MDRSQGWLWACCACGLVFWQAIPAMAAPPEPPNIVFVLADDLGYGDLSCFGQQNFQTPRLDRLAKSGVRLTQHYAGSTVCAPSRCALMTGMHTGHCYIRGNREYFPIGQEPLPEEALTLAEALQQAGYKTGLFGKWGLGYPGTAGDPQLQGFDEFYGYYCQRNAHRYYPEFVWDGGDRVELGGREYSHTLTVDRALDFIRRNRDERFFCFLPVAIPHAAMELPERLKAPFRKQFADAESVIGQYGEAEYNNPAAAFAAMVTLLDSDVGRVLDLLDELDLRDDTLVVFTSDNGPHQEGGHDPARFSSSGGLRGGKRDLYEGGIRVPAIVSWPGVVPNATESDFACAGWDWFPTLTEVAGCSLKQYVGDGVSLVPTLTGSPGQTPHEVLYWEFHEGGGRQAIRVGDWKAIRLNVSKNRDGPLELYNLDLDPAELRDVAAEHPEVVRRLAARIEQERTESPLFRFQSTAFKP